MVLDVNAALGRWPFQLIESDTPARLRGLLRPAGISKALVSPLDAVLAPAPDAANARLLQAARGSRWLAPLPVVNPTLPQWPDVFQWNGGRFPALKVYPNYHGYTLADDRLRALLRKLSRARKALLLPLRVEDERVHHALMKVPSVPADDIVRLARAFPGVRIVCCAPSTQEALALLKGAPNLCVDISYADGVDPVRKLAAGGKAFFRRILLGSHAPILTAASAVLKVREAELPDAQKQEILSGNARRVFRL